MEPLGSTRIPQADDWGLRSQAREPASWTSSAEINDKVRRDKPEMEKGSDQLNSSVKIV